MTRSRWAEKADTLISEGRGTDGARGRAIENGVTSPRSAGRESRQSGFHTNDRAGSGWRRTARGAGDELRLRRDALSQVTDPVGRDVTFQYDSRGRRTGVTDELGNQTTYTYNLLDLVTSVTAPYLDGGGPLTAPVTSYAYDYFQRSYVRHAARRRPPELYVRCGWQSAGVIEGDRSLPRFWRDAQDSVLPSLP